MVIAHQLAFEHGNGSGNRCGHTATAPQNFNNVENNMTLARLFVQQ
jgi:hypothetical protein